MFDTVDVKELYLLQVDWATTAFNDLELGNEPLVRNTWGMVREEATELLEAKDDVEILDAMCDLFVVFSQIIHLYRKKLQSLDLNEVGKIPGFNHKKFANKVLYLIDRQQELLNAQTLPVYWSLVADTLESEKDLPILEGIREVTSSNWSKFPTVQTLKEKHNVESEEEAISEECSWIVANRKHTGKVSGAVTDHTSSDTAPTNDNDSRLVVFRDKGGLGKIVKPSTYVEPNLEKLIKQGE